MVEAYVASARSPVGHGHFPSAMQAPSLGGGARQMAGRQPSAGLLLTAAAAGVGGASSTTTVVVTSSQAAVSSVRLGNATSPTAAAATASSRSLRPTRSPAPPALAAVASYAPPSVSLGGAAGSAAEADTMRVELQRAEAREAALREELRAVRLDKQELQDAVDSLRHAQFAALQGSVDAGDGMVPIATAEAARAAGQDALSYAYEQVQVTELRASCLERDLKGARLLAEAAAAGAASREAESAKLSAQVQSLKKQSEQLREQARHDAKKAAEKSSRKSAEEAGSLRADKAEQRVERLASRVEELVAEVKEAQIHAQVADALALQAQLEKAELESRLFERDMKLGELEAYTANHSALFTRAKAEVEGEKGALLRRIVDAEANATRLEEEQRRATSSRQHLLSEADEERNKMLKRACEAEARAARLEEESQGLSSRAVASQRVLEQAESEKSALVRQTATAEERAARLEEERNTLQRHLLEEQRSSLEVSAEVSRLRRSLQDTAARTQQLQADLAASTSAAHSAQAQAAQVAQAAQAAEAARAEAQAQVQAAQAEAHAAAQVHAAREVPPSPVAWAVPAGPSAMAPVALPSAPVSPSSSAPTLQSPTLRQQKAEVIDISTPIKQQETVQVAKLTQASLEAKQAEEKWADEAAGGPEKETATPQMFTPWNHRERPADKLKDSEHSALKRFEIDSVDSLRIKGHHRKEKMSSKELQILNHRLAASAIRAGQAAAGEALRSPKMPHRSESIATNGGPSFSTAGSFSAAAPAPDLGSGPASPRMQAQIVAQVAAHMQGGVPVLRVSLLTSSCARG
mmetsp:Transcript_30916/g.79356  ORF Transcript_30916/g.79356 Transcript_30916/m.79356 type:complete len:810 (+) Transcript_30916:49-2478(+)